VQGCSLALADVFRQARQEAIARRRPVAVMFPTAGGSRGSFGSFYILEGEDRPSVTRVRHFQSEYGDVQAFIGNWPLHGAVSGSLTTTVNMPGSKWSNFDLSAWLPPAHSSDFAFCYLPDGTLRCTPTLGNFSGNYHIAICKGLSYSGGGGSFTLQSAGQTFTLALSPAGGVAIDGGLTGQSGALNTLGSSPCPPVAAPPASASIPLADPVFVSEPKIYPPPDPSLLPPGVNATLTRDQFLSLEATAVSPSGHPLYCKWQVVDPIPPAGKGSYSLPGDGGRMLWDPRAPNGSGGFGAWKAVWQWCPPPEAKPNDIYRLQCLVQNYGGAPLDAQIKEVKIIPPGNVFFETNRSGGPEIWSMNADGSRQQPYIANARHPSANLDGTRLVFVRTADGNIYLRHPDYPSEDIQLTFNGGYTIPALSPNGTKLAFRRGDGIHVMKVSIDGCANNVTISDAPILPSGPGDWVRADTERLAWSKDGYGLLYTKDDGGRLHAFKANFSDGPGGHPQLVGTPQPFLAGSALPANEGPIWTPSWGVNGRIYYAVNKTSAGGIYDPYIFFGLEGPDPILNYTWGRDSYTLEQFMPERDPAGGDFILEVEQSVPVTINQSQIFKMDTNVPSGFTLGSAPRTPLTLTPGFYNTRPCWTK